MLPMTDAAVAALCGSRTRERVRVDAYLGDALVAEGLDVESVSLTWDATRQVQCQGTIKVVDPDGTLTPWVLGDVLAPGARLQVTYCCEDGSTLPRALLVVTKAAPESGRPPSPGTRCSAEPAGGGGTTAARHLRGAGPHCLRALVDHWAVGLSGL